MALASLGGSQGDWMTGIAGGLQGLLGAVQMDREAKASAEDRALRKSGQEAAAKGRTDIYNIRKDILDLKGQRDYTAEMEAGIVKKALGTVYGPMILQKFMTPQGFDVRGFLDSLKSGAPGIAAPSVSIPENVAPDPRLEQKVQGLSGGMLPASGPGMLRSGGSPLSVPQITGTSATPQTAIGDTRTKYQKKFNYGPR